ncbi:hypothetical protein PM082_022905 [Marasmius tenuissimus]|nr:hypothetical protein PM082_022905 [Marasmius tenuissimus]
MASNNAYDPFFPKDPQRQNSYASSNASAVSGSPNYPGHSFTSSPPGGLSPSSSVSKQQGTSIVLYRLAGNESGSNRGSTISETHSIMNEDNKYPSFRQQNDPLPSPAASEYSRLPRAALFSTTPSSTQASLLSQTPPRGLVPYEINLHDAPLHEEDDVLHDPKEWKGSKIRVAGRANGSRGLNWRAFQNVGMLAFLVLGMLMLFMIWPIIMHVQDSQFRKTVAENHVINGTGQVPFRTLTRELIDKDTPEAAKTRTGFDGKKYNLVFSDEFEEPGRTFFPGDDPYFEAMDFWYGVTQDLEWYDPRQVITRDGAMVITMDADMNRTTQPNLTPGSSAPFRAANNHDFSFRSGMVQTWNKLCFSSGYVEISVILPGADSEQNQYWPGAWTMGNLGRPGYPATSHMTWPYSYDECDVGTFPNQTNRDGLGPAAALANGRGGWEQYDGRLSVLKGQRLSACTCPNSEHPGPWGKFDGSNVERYRGRGAPEIDIIEIQHNDAGHPGTVASQSAQFAPFTHMWNHDQSGTTMYNASITKVNLGFPGSPLQQAVSALTRVPDEGFQGVTNRRYVTYGFEYWADPNARDDGFITWQVDGKPSFEVRASAVLADRGPEGSQVGRRIVPEEPMSLIMNLGISHNWGNIDYSTLIFPAEMMFDYVRIYQREGHENIGCDPKDYPTMDYIQRHLDQYMDWEKQEWEYADPKNRLWEGGC